MMLELWAFSCRPCPSIDAIDQSRALCTAVELLCSDRRNIRGRLRAQTVSSQPRMTRRLNIENATRSWHPWSSFCIWRAVTVTWATTWITFDCSTPSAQRSLFGNLPQKKKELISVQALNARRVIILGIIQPPTPPGFSYVHYVHYVHYVETNLLEEGLVIGLFRSISQSSLTKPYSSCIFHNEGDMMWRKKCERKQQLL